MNHALQMTFRLARTLGIAATVFVLSFMSSGGSLFEECQQEITQEIELFLSGQEEQDEDFESSVTVDFQKVPRQLDVRVVVQTLSLVQISERDRMNGLGANLRI